MEEGEGLRLLYNAAIYQQSGMDSSMATENPKDPEEPYINRKDIKCENKYADTGYDGTLGETWALHDPTFTGCLNAVAAGNYIHFYYFFLTIIQVMQIMKEKAEQ